MYAYNNANIYNLPNIARIFGRVISLLFALCNLFTISKSLRIYATYGVFPWEWSAFGTRTRINIRVSS